MLQQQRHPPAEAKPVVRFEMFEKKKPPQQPPPTFQYLPNTFQWPPVPGGVTYTQPNIVNQMFVGVADPSSKHFEINAIYEDMLPVKNAPTSQTTINERSMLSTYVKSMVLGGKDGEKISFRKGKNNLFDRLKTTEFNPYHYGGLKDNPYSTLPENLLLYRSCYPIKKGPYGKMCAKDSLGMNIRIYRMTRWEMMIGTQQMQAPDQSIKDLKIWYSEVWREILFYQTVHEKILKTMACPHFVMMYGYSLCDDSEINFEEITKIKSNKTAPAVVVPIKDEPGHIPSYIPTIDGYFVEKQQIPQKQQREFSFVREADGKKITIPYVVEDIAPPPVPAGLPKGMYVMPNPNAYASDVLTVLTESPTYNFMQWVSKKYEPIGNNYQMIHTGYYDKKIWESVLFQIMVGLYALQYNHIHITNFSLQNNVYIKDLTNVPATTTFWKYIINGISYYVPNYGYLVLFDSKFRTPEITINASRPSERYRRIIFSKDIIDDESAPSNDEIDKEVFKTFMNVFNSNNFGSEFEKNGGIYPSSDISAYINKINEIANAEWNKANGSKNIGDYIYIFMRQFMNNRIGTYLSKQEQEHIIKTSKKFMHGDVIVYEEASDTYKFVLFCGDTSGMGHILSSQNSVQNITGQAGKELDHTEKVSMNVPYGNLYAYSRMQPIKQDFKIGEAKLDDYDLLETYFITKSDKH